MKLEKKMFYIYFKFPVHLSSLTSIEFKIVHTLTFLNLLTSKLDFVLGKLYL